MWTHRHLVISVPYSSTPWLAHPNNAFAMEQIDLFKKYFEKYRHALTGRNSMHFTNWIFRRTSAVCILWPLDLPLACPQSWCAQCEHPLGNIAHGQNLQEHIKKREHSIFRHNRVKHESPYISTEAKLATKLFALYKLPKYTKAHAEEKLSIHYMYFQVLRSTNKGKLRYSRKHFTLNNSRGIPIIEGAGERFESPRCPWRAV